jgi:hypothetical protein
MSLPVDHDRVQPALGLAPRPQVGSLPCLDDVDGETGQRSTQGHFRVVHEKPPLAKRSLSPSLKDMYQAPPGRSAPASRAGK